MFQSLSLTSVTLEDYVYGLLIDKANWETTKKLTKIIKRAMRDCHQHWDSHRRVFVEVVDSVCEQPEWILESRRCVGGSMRSELRKDNKWSLYSICRVYLFNKKKDAFQKIQLFKDQSSRDGLEVVMRRFLQTMDTLHESRQAPNLRDLVRCLEDVIHILRAFRLDKKADLVEHWSKNPRQWRDEETDETSWSTRVQVKWEDCERLGIFRIVRAFENALESTVGATSLATLFEGADDDKIARLLSTEETLSGEIDVLRAARVWLRRDAKGSEIPNESRVFDAARKVLNAFDADLGTEFVTALNVRGDGIEERKDRRRKKSVAAVENGEAEGEETVVLFRKVKKMTIFPKRLPYFVGRTKEIGAVSKALLHRSGTRVLIHGTMGIGKTSLAAHVVRHERVRAKEDLLQGWIVATSDSDFQLMMYELFLNRRPEVIKDAMDSGRGESLTLIKHWLRSNDKWLFVIDDLQLTNSILDIWFPKQSCSGGHLLVVSKFNEKRLDYEFDATIDLKSLRVTESVDLWKTHRVHSIATYSGAMDDEQLSRFLGGVGVEEDDNLGGDPYALATLAKVMQSEEVTRTAKASEFIRKIRELCAFCDSNKSDSMHVASSNWCAKQMISRMKTVAERRARRYHAVLRSGCGTSHRATEETKLVIVTDEDDRKEDKIDCVNDDDVDGDRGVGMVNIARTNKVVRDKAANVATNAALEEAIASSCLRALVLTSVMTVLPPQRTPVALFLSRGAASGSRGTTARPKPETVSERDGEVKDERLDDLTIRAIENCFDLDYADLYETREVLIEAGLLIRSTDPRYLGTMHKSTQRCLDAYIRSCPRDEVDFQALWSTSHLALASVLNRRFSEDYDAMDREVLDYLRLFAPCVEYMFGHQDGVSKQVHLDISRQKLGELHMMALTRLSKFYIESASNGGWALFLAEIATSTCETIPVSPVVRAKCYDYYALAMNGMGRKNGARQRWKYALEVLLKWQKNSLESEGVTEIVRPAIPSKTFAHSMSRLRVISNILNGYGSVLWNDKKLLDARKVYETSLALKFAVFRAGYYSDPAVAHRDIATVLNNLGTVLEKSGAVEQGLRRHKEALNMRRLLYGPGSKFKGVHPDIAGSLNNIGACLSGLQRYEEALQVHEDSLRMKYVLYGSKVHPEIAASLVNLTTLHFKEYERLSAKIKRMGRLSKKGRTVKLERLNFESRAKLKRATERCTKALAIFDEVHKNDVCHPRVVKIVKYRFLLLRTAGEREALFHFTKDRLSRVLRGKTSASPEEKREVARHLTNMHKQAKAEYSLTQTANALKSGSGIAALAIKPP
eukprot:g2951.t1